MKIALAESPTGAEHLLIQSEVVWHSFPEFANNLLQQLGADCIRSVTRSEIADMHWYEFRWQGTKYRLVFEEWPPECSIESTEIEGNLKALAEVLASL